MCIRDSIKTIKDNPMDTSLIILSLLGSSNNIKPPAIGVHINNESNGILEIIKYY